MYWTLAAHAGISQTRWSGAVTHLCFRACTKGITTTGSLAPAAERITVAAVNYVKTNHLVTFGSKKVSYLTAGAHFSSTSVRQIRADVLELEATGAADVIREAVQPPAETPAALGDTLALSPGSNYKAAYKFLTKLVPRVPPSRRLVMLHCEHFIQHPPWRQSEVPKIPVNRHL